MSDTLNVIYIDDDMLEAQILTLGMRKHNINILHIPDAQEQSLEVLFTPEYVSALAVFIDLRIAGASGLDVARWMREEGDERPFYLVTAGANPDPDTLRELDMVYKQKPLDLPEIAELLWNNAG